MDLYELWTAIVVDAMRSGAPPGTVRFFDVSATALPGETFSSTHSFGPAAGIEIARALGRLPATIEVIGIEAGDLAVGAELSPGVAEAVRSLSKELSDA
jgi:hydrogenase maturation protease